MTDLSPAADAVLDAYMINCGWLDGPLEKDYRCAAAVLRAAADQHTELEVPFNVVDDWEKIKGSCNSFYTAAEWGYDQALKKLLAIADELESING